ncbi:MAG TPA: hypothetical protein VLX09_24405 [Stellaceae bacterium]|nr:hypothetical protein [Stellaceae bacterium]
MSAVSELLIDRIATSGTAQALETMLSDPAVASLEKDDPVVAAWLRYLDIERQRAKLPRELEQEPPDVSAERQRLNLDRCDLHAFLISVPSNSFSGAAARLFFATLWQIEQLQDADGKIDPTRLSGRADIAVLLEAMHDLIARGGIERPEKAA